MSELVCRKVDSDPEKYLCKRESKKTIFKVPQRRAPKKPNLLTENNGATGFLSQKLAIDFYKIHLNYNDAITDTSSEREIERLGSNGFGPQCIPRYTLNQGWGAIPSSDAWLHYVKGSKLDSSVASNQWMETVRHHMSKASPKMDETERALWGITSAFNEYKIRYSDPNNGFGIRGRVTNWVRGFPIRDFVQPGAIQKHGYAVCLETSRLFVATLVRLGFQAVLIANGFHALTGIITREKKSNLTAVTAFSKVNGKKVYIYPLETTEVTHAIQIKGGQLSYGELKEVFKKALGEGIDTALSFSKTGSAIVDTTGEIIVSSSGDLPLCAEF